VYDLYNISYVNAAHEKRGCTFWGASGGVPWVYDLYNISHVNAAHEKRGRALLGASGGLPWVYDLYPPPCRQAPVECS